MGRNLRQHHSTAPGGIRMVSELRSSDFESASDWYDYVDPDHFWIRWRLGAMVRFLRDERVPTDANLRALDIGAGRGVFREQVEALSGWVVDCTDLNLAALQHVRAGRGVVMYYDICEQRPEFRHAYDVVTVLDVLEHIEDAGAFVRAALFHVKVGGYLVINVPALQRLHSRYDDAVGHLRRYTRKPAQRR